MRTKFDIYVYIYNFSLVLPNKESNQRYTILETI